KGLDPRIRPDAIAQGDADGCDPRPLAGAPGVGTEADRTCSWRCLTFRPEAPFERFGLGNHYDVLRLLRMDDAFAQAQGYYALDRSQEAAMSSERQTGRISRRKMLR